MICLNKREINHYDNIYSNLLFSLPDCINHHFHPNKEVKIAEHSKSVSQFKPYCETHKQYFD